MFFNTITSRPKKQEGSVFENPATQTLVVSYEGIRQQIRELAYKKWEEAGYPEGKDEEFWVSAERELFGDEPFADGGYRVKLEDGMYVIIRPT